LSERVKLVSLGYVLLNSAEKGTHCGICLLCVVACAISKK